MRDIPSLENERGENGLSSEMLKQVQHDSFISFSIRNLQSAIRNYNRPPSAEAVFPLLGGIPLVFVIRIF